MKKNNNIATMYHDRHDQLKLLVGSSAKAEFLSKCIYWWQISKYKIKNSNHIWFTRTTDELAAGGGLSESSVGRYLREFSDKGLIEKRVIKRFSKKHNQEIACLHIRITERLIIQLQPGKLKPSTKTEPHSDKKTSESENLTQVDGTGSVNLSNPSYNKEKQYNHNNNTVSDNVSCVDKSNSMEKKQSTSNQEMSFEIEKQIGEMVTEPVKQRIKGMMVNLEKQHNICLNNKERLFAEIIFSLVNPHQFSNITCINHKINIISRLLRQKRWATPKGFYNHFEAGKDFKQKDELADKKRAQKKLEQELLGVNDPKLIAEIKARFEKSARYEAGFSNKSGVMPQRNRVGQQAVKNKLADINSQILSEGNYLRQMQKDFEKGLNHASQQLIDTIAGKLARLYDEQAKFEQKLCELNQNVSLCA